MSIDYNDTDFDELEMSAEVLLSNTICDQRVRWRVWFGSCFVVGQFVRKIDAEIARRSLAEAGVRTAGDARRLGYEEVKRIMHENLQW